MVLGKYTIVERVGRGGMATVYAARHRNGKRVAIKALHPSHQETQASVERFFREGVIANLIEHPGALEVYDEGRTEEGTCVLVCEYLEGCTLHELQQSSGAPLSLSEVADALFQVLDVLAVAHRAGVIHRDIKPANLFLTTDARVKLLDFGVSRSATAVDALATVDGELLGTPAFMSPEQAGGIVAELDATSDLWSLAATAVALLSGESPRQGRSVSELLVAALTLEMPSTRVSCPSLPGEVALVLDRALAREKHRRFQSAVEFRDALAMALPNRVEHALSGERARQVRDERALSVRSPSRVKPSGFVALSAVMVLLVLTGGAWWSRTQRAQAIEVPVALTDANPPAPEAVFAMPLVTAKDEPQPALKPEPPTVKKVGPVPASPRQVLVQGTTFDAGAPLVHELNQLDRRY